MRKTLLYIMALCLPLSFAACGGSDGGDDPTTPPDPGTKDPDPSEVVAKEVTKTNKMNVYAHYMPWFISPKTSGAWNHWTMSSNALKDDMSNLASHYKPLTGAYASDDEKILDYQCMLMKYSGIDGVMVDWYGSQKDVNDYETNDKHTKALLKAIEKAKLKFVLVYEDNTLKNLVDEEKATQARQDMIYAQSTYFGSSSYTKIGDCPLLMCFGPMQVQEADKWNFIFQGQSKKPKFVVLNGFSGYANNGTYKNCEGEYLWVNPTPDYSTAKKFGMYIGGAMPGFWDVYKEFGQGNGYPTYDRENGALFDRQLNAAKNAGLNWLQISTWNDYGEGTTIEPTEEYKYQYLTALQGFTGVVYKQSHLETIFKWYTLSVKYANDSVKAKKLKECYTYLNALMPDKAEEILRGL